MTCKLSSLFSIGEDFDDEDLLGTDWGPRSSSSRPTGVGAAVPSASSLNNAQSNLPAQQKAAGTAVPPKSHVVQDDFDDWDIDLTDLDEVEQPVKSTIPSPPAATVTPACSTKILRPTTVQKQTGAGLREIAHHTVTCSNQTLPHGGLRTISSHVSSYDQSVQKQNIGGLRDLSRFTFMGNQHPQRSSCGSTSFPPSCSPTTPLHRPPLSSTAANPHSPGILPGLTAASPSPGLCLKKGPEQVQRHMSTPVSSKHNRSLFEAVSPAPSHSTITSLFPLHTPVLTNHLVQLVSASNSKKRPRSESHRPRTRRFPGPAGLLPQQPQGQSLDDIVVSVPNTPAHGAVARPPSQCSSSQTDEDDFSGAAWTAIKTEMGLDERNPLCFLHTYSVVMVLRKAALKQLVKNKVPNMAVLLKSIIHTNTDAKAVFKDPTGEMQGTVHRQLLEDRAGELRPGAVLLLKQVGVFSPSHRNHYLNVTPNNLLRVYSPDGASLSSTQQLPLLAMEPMLPLSTPCSSNFHEPVSRMQLLFDEDNEGEAEKSLEPQQGSPGTTVSKSRNPQMPAAAPQDSGWGADDLDELLGELPEGSYSI